MENLRKKNETETQNTLEGHMGRLEQAEDRLSDLEDKMEIKGKTEELLVKQLNTCERNMQELTNSIKRPNMRIMNSEEGKEVQAKGIHNIVNKIITENIPNLEKVMTIQVQEASRTPSRLDQNRLPHDTLSLKQQAQRIVKEYRKL
jgi:chromosome segregation ATPase